MARKTVVYDDFSGGEFGRLGAWKAPKNSWTGSNMMMYRTGELGVRPGLVKRNPTGLATGVVHAFGTTPVPLNDAFFVQGTAVRTFSTGGTNLKTSATALAEIPSAPCDTKRDTTTILIASPADKIYRLTPQGGVDLPLVAGLTGSPGALAIAVYGDRIVAGAIDGSFIYRLRYSDAANPNSWPAANFVDIGDGWHISGLYSQRQHLLIMKQVGEYVMTGVPGVNNVLRKVATTGGGVRALQGTLDLRDNLWYAGDGYGWPAVFNGTQDLQFKHLDLGIAFGGGDAGTGTNPPPAGIATLTGRDDGVAYITDSGDRGILLANGVWSLHTFGVNVSGYVATYPGSGVFICDGGGAAATPNFYAWNPLADSPGLESGTDMRAGDDTSTALTGSVTFPEWWATDTAEVRVRAVIVDFRKWNTGSATTNHFDLKVDALRRYQAGAAQASTTVSFDEAASSSSASGTLERRIFGFGEQGLGNGFQLVFTNVRGIAIQRIEVILDSEPARI